MQLPSETSELFRQNAVTGYDFAELVADDGAALAHELGIHRAAYQKKLLRSMRMLMSGVGVAPDKPQVHSYMYIRMLHALLPVDASRSVCVVRCLHLPWRSSQHNCLSSRCRLLLLTPSHPMLHYFLSGASGRGTPVLWGAEAEVGAGRRARLSRAQIPRLSFSPASYGCQCSDSNYGCCLSI